MPWIPEVSASSGEISRQISSEWKIGVSGVHNAWTPAWGTQPSSLFAQREIEDLTPLLRCHPPTGNRRPDPHDREATRIRKSKA